MTTVFIAGYSSRSEQIDRRYADAKEQLEAAGFHVISQQDIKPTIRNQAATICQRADILCTIAGVDFRLTRIARVLGIPIRTPNDIIHKQ